MLLNQRMLLNLILIIAISSMSFYEELYREVQERFHCRFCECVIRNKSRAMHAEEGECEKIQKQTGAYLAEAMQRVASVLEKNRRERQRIRDFGFTKEQLEEMKKMRNLIMKQEETESDCSKEEIEGKVLDEANDVCGICLEPKQQLNTVEICMNKHRFHTVCVEEMLFKKYNRCPLCRCSNLLALQAH